MPFTPDSTVYRIILCREGNCGELLTSFILSSYGVTKSFRPISLGVSPAILALRVLSVRCPRPG